MIEVAGVTLAWMLYFVGPIVVAFVSCFTRLYAYNNQKPRLEIAALRVILACPVVMLFALIGAVHFNNCGLLVGGKPTDFGVVLQIVPMGVRLVVTVVPEFLFVTLPMEFYRSFWQYTVPGGC